MLKQNRIDHLVAIGGDGTFRGCLELSRYWDGRVIGCPGTIDNDLAGTDVSIGFTSAVSTAAEAIDKVRDTADATERLFLVEVMGAPQRTDRRCHRACNGRRCGARSRDPVPGRGGR